MRWHSTRKRKKEFFECGKGKKERLRVVKATKYVPKKCAGASITPAEVAKNEAKIKPCISQRNMQFIIITIV